jgi:hypothetical protein
MSFGEKEFKLPQGTTLTSFFPWGTIMPMRKRNLNCSKKQMSKILFDHNFCI